MFVVGVAVLLGTLTNPKVDSIKVETTAGPVIGRSEDNFDAFLGLPYAQPPVRFAPAILHDKAWTVPRDATTYGAPCFQTPEPFEHPQSTPTVPDASEDCLFVNVWRPKALPKDAKLPVLVWVHGGGFVAGAGSVKWYEGGGLAARNDVVVVNLNYRLGPLGFLASPLFAKYGGNGGMNGINDQITALEWVQQHIASFGGDPTQVTVMGESSGGISVCLLNTAPRAKGLFSRAIIQSGPWCAAPASLYPLRLRVPPSAFVCLLPPWFLLSASVRLHLQTRLS